MHEKGSRHAPATRGDIAELWKLLMAGLALREMEYALRRGDELGELQAIHRVEGMLDAVVRRFQDRELPFQEWVFQDD